MQMIFLWLAAVWCRDWDVLVVHEFSFLDPRQPANQCHWVHSELPGAAEILKTESFALIFPLCQCHQICQPVQDILEWKNCFPSTDRKDLLPLKGGQRVAICSNTFWVIANSKSKTNWLSFSLCFWVHLHLSVCLFCPIFIICVCVFESLSWCVLEFSSLSLKLLVRVSLSLFLCVS